MGASNILGLLFEINADPSKAEAALKRFEATTSTELSSLAKAAESASKTGARTFDSGLAPAVGRSREELRRADVAADVLRQQFGIHLPRSVNRMIAESSLIGPALSAAFAPTVAVLFVENMGKVVKGIQDAASAIGGFGEASRKAFEENVKASNEARAPVKPSPPGLSLVAETNRNLAALEAQKTALESTGGAIKRIGETAVAAFSGNAVALGVAVAKTAAYLNVNNQIATLQTRLAEQLSHLGELEDEKHKKKKARHEEEKTDTAEIASLFSKLSLQVYSTDDAYREYLATLSKINNLRDEHSKQVLASLNEERFLQELAKQSKKRADDQTEAERQYLEALTRFPQAADPAIEAHKRLEQAVDNVWAKSKHLREEWILQHTQMRLLSDGMYGRFIPAFQAAAATVENFRVLGTNALADFQRGMSSNIAYALVYRESIGAALQAALKQALATMAAQAYFEALKATALGFYLLAIQDYRGAAMAFKSAAIWGAVGTGAALAGRAIPNPNQAAAGGQQGAGGAASAGAGSPAAAEQKQQPMFQVIFQGPVYGGQAGVDELVRHISEAVTERDVNLTAYTVVRQPATRA